MPVIVNKAVHLANVFITNLDNGLLQLIHIGFVTMIYFLNSLAEDIRQNEHLVFDAGYNVASAIIEGMVQGLGDLAWKVKDKMEEIILSLPAKALKILGIGSPSKVFYDIGMNSMRGLANGITKYGHLPIYAMDSVTNRVVEAAKAQFGSIQDAFHHGMGGADLSPTIKPVLDLSHVEKNAPNIQKLLKVPKIDATASKIQAAAISKAQAASIKAASDATKKAPSVNFTQNNYSPESLSHVEIYRQTNNQIARLQRTLTTA